MALYKPILQDDGVTTDYHRISSLTLSTNSHISIGVFSYVNADSRNTKYEGPIDRRPYTRSTTYELDYDENMTIVKAYEYLKTLSEFEDAEDV